MTRNKASENWLLKRSNDRRETIKRYYDTLSQYSCLFGTTLVAFSIYSFVNEYFQASLPCACMQQAQCSTGFSNQHGQQMPRRTDKQFLWCPPPPFFLEKGKRDYSSPCCFPATWAAAANTIDLFPYSSDAALHEFQRASHGFCSDIFFFFAVHKCFKPVTWKRVIYAVAESTAVQAKFHD